VNLTEKQGWFYHITMIFVPGECDCSPFPGLILPRIFVFSEKIADFVIFSVTGGQKNIING